MIMGTCAAVRVSAPGKVLLTGGYLILEERFAGLVLATSARFHSTISRCRVEETRDAGEAGDDHLERVVRVRVESPQFHQTVVAHAVRMENGRLELRVSADHDRNAYIEETLLCALNGVAGLDARAFFDVCDAMRSNAEELLVVLQADNAFYSQVQRLQQDGKPLSRQSLEELPAFLPPIMEVDAGTRKTSIAKTGLGSSAALVTSLVGAVVEFLLPTTEPIKSTEANKLDLIHNLAQLSHCFVQRKIGSGFDVSAASYGTQRYSRFPPAMLHAFTATQKLEPASIAECVRNQALWRRSERVQPFDIPTNFHLLMGDISTGSTTVSMVKQVLQWQTSNPSESARVVAALAAANARVEQGFSTLSAMSSADPAAFASVCGGMANKSLEEWTAVDAPIGNALLELRSCYQEVRSSFREMGVLSGVPIEPREQTSLIDATLQVPGVLIAGVPGAGGYDALFVLTLDSTVLDRVEQLWLSWADSHPNTVICPLLCDVASSLSSALSVEGLSAVPAIN